MAVATPAPLVGALADFPVDQVLRFLEGGARCGHFAVDGPLPVELVLGGAELAFATAGHERDGLVEVLFHVLLMGGGAFTFTPDPEVQVAGGWPLVAVLDEVSDRVERWRALSKVIPSLDVVVRLIPTAVDGEPVALAARTWNVVAALDGVRGVREVTMQVGGDAFATMEEVHDLIRRGLAEVTPDDVPA